MAHRYIAVEGNIGSGKSTLAHLLAKHYNATLVLEQFADNNFLPKFYKEPERYAFPLELSFLADRYKQLKELLINPDIFQQKIVSDYTFMKCKLFARVNLKEDEYDLFQKFFDIIDLHLPPPDLLIYLHAPISKLQQNIRKRGRNFEQAIPDTYLEKVQQVYQQYLRQEMTKTLVIDTTHADFVGDPAQFERLIAFLDKDYNFRTHYFSVD
jgi:deoxyguanosine kinase